MEEISRPQGSQPMFVTEIEEYGSPRREPLKAQNLRSGLPPRAMNATALNLDTKHSVLIAAPDAINETQNIQRESLLDESRDPSSITKI